jgi:hypothetical protein
MSEPNAPFWLSIPDVTKPTHEQKDTPVVKLWNEAIALRLGVEHLRILNTTPQRRVSELETELSQPQGIHPTPVLLRPKAERGANPPGDGQEVFEGPAWDAKAAGCHWILIKQLKPDSCQSQNVSPLWR